MHATIPDFTDIILVVLLPLSPSDSSDLDYVGAQRIMLLGRFLVYSTHLISGGSRPAAISLILYLSKKGCLDSKNWDIIDTSL